jgi:hypothetical protein
MQLIAPEKGQSTTLLKHEQQNHISAFVCIARHTPLAQFGESSLQCYGPQLLEHGRPSVDLTIRRAAEGTTATSHGEKVISAAGHTPKVSKGHQN